VILVIKWQKTCLNRVKCSRVLWGRIVNDEIGYLAEEISKKI